MEVAGDWSLEFGQSFLQTVRNYVAKLQSSDQLIETIVREKKTFVGMNYYWKAVEFNNIITYPSFIYRN
jgi:hypothetical protein